MLSLAISAGSTALQPGQSTLVTISLAGGAAADLQWDYSYAGLSAGTPVIGAAATAANKSISSTASRIIISGLDASLISPGAVASFTVTVPIPAAPGSAVVVLSNPVAADALGNSVPITAASLTIIILPQSVVSVAAVPATSSSLMVAPTVAAGANVHAPPATSSSLAKPPTITVSGSPVVSPDVVITAPPATASSVMVPPTIQAGAVVAAPPAMASSAMPNPVVSGNQPAPLSPSTTHRGPFRVQSEFGTPGMFRATNL